MLKKAWLHFKLITKHKYEVFKLCIKAGIPFRGFMHDWSKYGPTEFIESMKYYQGNRSPIPVARTENGYSKAWLHHKGRNKHHIEYWYDWQSIEKTPKIPYKYVVEMICDQIAAGIIYRGKQWNNNDPINYWNNFEKSRELYNPKIEKYITKVKEDVAKFGIDKVINKKYLKEQYEKIVNNNQEENFE